MEYLGTRLAIAAVVAVVVCGGALFYRWMRYRRLDHPRPPLLLLIATSAVLGALFTGFLGPR